MSRINNAIVSLTEKFLAPLLRYYHVPGDKEPVVIRAAWQPVAKTIAIRWLHLLMNRHQNEHDKGVIRISTINDCMLPENVSDKDLSAHFQGIGVYVNIDPASGTDVECIREVLREVQAKYASLYPLPPEACEVLELYGFTLD